MTKTVFIIATLLMLLGCSNEEELLFKELPKAGWAQQESIEFRYAHRLPKKEASIHWILRHDNEYPYSNIHLIATWVNPKGVENTDTLSYILAKPNGEWLGKGLYIKEHRLPFVAHFLLDEPGEYLFRIRPAVRATEKLVADNMLPGIHQIGIAINPKSND